MSTTGALGLAAPSSLSSSSDSESEPKLPFLARELRTDLDAFAAASSSLSPPSESESGAGGAIVTFLLLAFLDVPVLTAFFVALDSS